MRKLKVIKKDESIEPFSMEKLIESIQSMGLSKELAKKVSRKVANELYKVESSQIRELIIKILKKMDPELAKKKIQYDMRKKESEHFMPIP